MSGPFSDIFPDNPNWIGRLKTRAIIAGLWLFCGSPGRDAARDLHEQMEDVEKRKQKKAKARK